MAMKSMHAERPFRFGVQWSGAKTRSAWKELAITAEALGYDVFIMPDHFGGQFAVGPALAIAAEATTTLRIATLVLQNDLRHPTLVAQEAATLDVLSEGRFELGLGAGGSLMLDYEWTGIPFAKPAVRIERLEESFQIIKGLFAEGPLTFAGHHYTIIEYEGQPKPIQRPRLPILLGGGGRRLLTLAAREADIISIFPSMLKAGGGFHEDELSGAAFAKKCALVQDIARDRIDQPELQVLTQAIVVTDNRRAEIDELARKWERPAADLEDSPQICVGTVEQIADHLRSCRARFGISYFVVFGHAMKSFSPVIASLRRS